MRIEWIDVENFKGFERRRFEFDEHFTLVVGTNGSGKTSLIRALRLILQSWVDGARTRHSGITADLIRLHDQQLGTGIVVAPVFPLRLQCRIGGVRRGMQLSVECKSEDENGLAAALDQPFQVIRPVVKEDLEAVPPRLLPLCICFNANRRIDGSNKPDLNRALGTLPRRLDGYEEWDQNSTSAQRLAEWMLRWQSVSEEEGSEAAILRHVRAAIVNGVPGMSSIRYSAKRAQLVIDWQTGETVDFSKLSDGQTALIAMIGDIARRAALLNPHLDDPVTGTPGVVLIDEIDLHLHPRWQRRIMEDLRRVFPKLQFIATTHSPIIISAAKDAKVIVLEEGGSRELSQAYGLDVNSVVEDLQGGEARDREIKQLFSEANEMIEAGRFAEARTVSARIRKELNGPDRDLVELDTMIDNLEALANAPD